MTTLLQKRRKELRTELVQIEKQIYDLETAYLDETKEIGNIFTGWDAYLSAEKVKQKRAPQIEDRHFSLSSITSPASRKEESKQQKGNAARGRPSKKARLDEKASEAEAKDDGEQE